MPRSSSERRDIRRFRPAAVLVATLSPGVAEAHAFTAGQGAYALFVEGASLVFHTPGLCVAVLSLGLLIGLWKVDGMPLVWPSLLIGTAFGLALPFLVLADATLALYVLALGLATLAILHLGYGVRTMRFVSALAGATIAYGAVSQHGLAGLPPMIVAGILTGLNLVVPMVAGLATLPQRWTAGAWPIVGLRIVASWLIALTMLMLSFAFR